MLKKRAAALLLALALLLGAAPLPALAEETGGENTGRFTLPDFDVPCKAAILISQDTGEILYQKNPDQQLPIASITKVMTLLLTFEAVEAGKIGWDDIVPVSEHAFNMGGSQIWLEPGEQFTLHEMVKAICVASANDAAVAVAEYVGGSEPVFCEMMNQKAAQLGMASSTFKNACGLDIEGHLSTARDVSIMSRELLTKYPKIHEYTTIWMDTLRGGQTQLVNTNKLLRRYQGINGLKTGTTSGAGVCISASAERDGLRLIAVVLGASSSAERFDAATTLLDYGFANFEMAACPQPENAPQNLPVRHGSVRTVELTYPETASVLLKKGGGANLSCQIELPEALEAPITAGQQVGELVMTGEEGELGRWPITAANEAPALTFGKALGILARGMLRL